jgi:regulator of sigma E protease
VGNLDVNGPAAKAGIHEGDQVVKFDDISNPTWEDITIKEISSPKQPLDVVVKRDGQRMHFTLTPISDEKQGVGYLGWSQETEVRVLSIVSGMDAQRQGIEPGDILVSANGIPLRSTTKLLEIERETDGRPLDIVFSRKGQDRHATVTPIKRNMEGQGERWMIGLTTEPRVEFTKLPLREAFVESVRQNTQSAKVIFKVLEGIVERRMSPKSIVGPVGIVQMSGEAAREGAATYFGLMAMVSLNLAIVNLLPIPILDGGVILMLLVEMLMRRDLDLKMKEAVVKVGFVFLMVVVIFTIYNDISRMLPG